ncbi:serine/threonine-protein kinase haspin [Phaenicophaeus curvirostris]|uniref:serine/threonine-protein kinase haspin n=1 Tax=Phaenicophaeus curvirostris TaxID=33595 RepID=UPI0037F0CA13
MPLQPRLLRTYSRRGGRLRLLPPPDRWISPPQDRKRFFSSTSAGSSALSSAPSDDPDFSPPRKLRRQPQGKRRLRPRRGAGKENRSSDSSSPSPPPASRGAAARRHRRAPRRNPRSGGEQQRPPRSGGEQQRPPRSGGEQQRPPRSGGEQQRPPRSGGEQRSGEQRPLRGNGEQRPLQDSAGQCSAERRPLRGNREQRPLQDSAGQCSAERRPLRGNGERRPLQDGARQCSAERRPLRDSTQQCSTERHPVWGNGEQRPLQDSARQCSTERRPLRGNGERRPLQDGARQCSPPAPPRRPLLCSTPHGSTPLAPLRPLALLSVTPEGGSGLAGSPELYSPPNASNGSSLLLLESPQEEREQLPPLSGMGGVREEQAGWSCPRGTSRDDEDGRSRELSLQWKKSGRVLRASARRTCPAQTPLCTPKALVLPPANHEPRLSVPYDGAASNEPGDDVRKDSTEGTLPCRPSRANARQLTPVVVVDPREVSVWLMSTKCNKKAFQPACPQPESPSGPQGILENKYKRTKVAPGEGSTCRKACISGFSASRWGKQISLCPKRYKNKRQQQHGGSFLRPQGRQKGMKKRVLEMSEGITDNDYSLLNTSQCWGRVRASLSFHKKKKVTTEESFCNSIRCTLPDKAQCSTWSTSSMILLASTNSCSVLELLLTDAEKVFGECQQEGPIAFEDCIPLDKMKECKKIGEGVFGEVFQIDSERGPVALKIIPIEGTERVNGEAQKSFGEILPEIIISKELSLLSDELVNRTVGFISLYSVHCVQGAYPKYLLEAWDKYHQEMGSENDRPDLFGDEQLFMILEFEFGGHDLENMRNRLSSVASAKSVLQQVTAALAVAEQALHFEHRDLHWGNVLVKKTDVKELNYVLNGTTHTIPTSGIHVNIIDYTLSRLEKDGLTVFCDLSTDEELFQGTGDYQFDIYRQMKAENSNNWTDYHPHSNVLWLHYLSDKLLKGMSYKKKESTSTLRKIKWQLSKFHKEVLSFESANEVLQKSSLFQ